MNSFSKVLQFNGYLIVKAVIFGGHFNVVQASCEILKSALLIFFFSTFEARLNFQQAFGGQTFLLLIANG